MRDDRGAGDNRRIEKYPEDCCVFRVLLSLQNKIYAFCLLSVYFPEETISPRILTLVALPEMSSISIRCFFGVLSSTSAS